MPLRDCVCTTARPSAQSSGRPSEASKAAAPGQETTTWSLLRLRGFVRQRLRHQPQIVDESLGFAVPGFRIRRSQQRRWMHRRQYDRSERRLDEFTAVLSHTEGGTEKRLRGSRTEADYRLRLHDRQLDVQPRTAGSDVLGPRLLVNAPLAARLPVEMLHDVGHIDLLPIDPRGVERAGEQLAGRADKRPADSILLIAGLLTDEHESGLPRPFAEDRLRAALPQFARLAARGGVSHAWQRGVRG